MSLSQNRCTQLDDVQEIVF